jgi:hypothetical protein
VGAEGRDDERQVRPLRARFDPNEIGAAIDAGKLQYRVGSMHGNPWLRLLRSEAERLANELHGRDEVERRQHASELARVRRELKRLRAEVEVLEQRQAELARLAAR